MTDTQKELRQMTNPPQIDRNLLKEFTAQVAEEETDRNRADLLELLKNISNNIDKIDKLTRPLPPAINVANAFLYGPFIFMAVVFVLATIGALTGHTLHH